MLTQPVVERRKNLLLAELAALALTTTAHADQSAEMVIIAVGEGVPGLISYYNQSITTGKEKLIKARAKDLEQHVGYIADSAD